MKFLTENEYNKGLAYIEKYFNSNFLIGSPEGDYFEMVMDAIMEYEAIHYPITSSD